MSIGLTAAELSRVFPFYIACDRQFRVLRVGDSLTRLSPQLTSAQLSDLARVLRPAGGLDLARLDVEGSTSVLLELSEPLVVLRGQALARQDGILLLVSPWITDANQLGRLGLALQDFPDHDPMVDYLRLLEAKNAALSQATALGARLQQASLAAEKALEQREVASARLEALIRRLPFGVLVEDEHGRVVLANERYMELFGLPGTPENLVGQDGMTATAGASVFFIKSSDFVLGMETRRRAREAVIAEELTLNDGRTLERDYVPIFDSHTHRGHMWQYRDVSAQRKAALRLSAARDRAEVASAAKSRFLAMMSHEIRTPLGAIVGLSDLLQGSVPVEEQRDLVARLGRNARHLIELLEDILDFAKIEAGEVRVFRGALEPRGVVREALDALGARAAEKGLELRVELDEKLPARVMGDATRLRQVLVNFLSNAIKFTASGHVTVKVSPRAFARNGVSIVYEVSDTGRGIPQDAQARIFDRFVRVTQVDGEYVPGTGLGLSIVRGLVNLMGGTVEIDSKVGSGSTFRAVIPHDLASGEDAHHSNPPPRASLRPMRGARLLLLEDDADNRAVFRTMLQQAGHHVDVVGDGEAGLAKATRACYDLIFTDLQMPIMDGITFTQRLRAHEQRVNWPRAPIVAVTAHAIATFKTQALAAGMDDYAAKPVTTRLFERLIERWVDRRPLIVAVDDEPDHLLYLRRILGHSGALRVVGVPSAEELFQILDARPVDLLLLDMSLPGMSGYEAAQRIRARSDTRGLPIVALTAHAGDEEARRCRDAGCNVHLVKPTRQRLLERVIDKLLGGRVSESIPPPALPASRISDMVPDYVLRRCGDFEAIIQALEAPNADSLRQALRLAHNAKGSGGAYGLPWLSEGAGGLEVAIRRGQTAEALELARGLLARLRDFAASGPPS